MMVARNVARHGVAFVALIGCLFAAGSVAAQGREIRVGVRAHSGVEAARLRWSHTVNHLTAEIPGAQFILVPFVECSEMERALAENRVDLVLTDSLTFVQLQHKYGLQPLATLRNTRSAGGRVSFAAVIFTRADRRDIVTVDDLRGHSLMGVHVHAFGGWLMARATLVGRGIDPFHDCSRVLFAPSATQQEVVRTVLAGDVDAGTVRTGIIEDMLERGEIAPGEIRILEPVTDHFPLPHTTRLYPEWPMAAAAGLDDDLAEAIRTVLLGIEISSEAARQGDYTGWIFPLDYDPLHQVLEVFGLPPYENFGTATWGQVWRLYRTTILLAAVGLALILAATLWMVRLNRLLRTSQSALLRHRENLEREVVERSASLAASESRYRDLASVAPVGIFHTDAEGRCTFFSPFWTRLTGLAPESALGMRWADTVHTDDRARVMEHWREARRSGRHEPNEFRIIGPDGDIRWILVVAEPQHDADGSLTGFIGCVTDLTERHAAEEQLHRLAEAIAQTSDAVVITDAEGCIQYLNPAYEILSGHRAEGVAGRGFDMLRTAGGDPLDRREIWEALAAGDPWRGRTRLRHRDGEERRVEATISPVLNDSGELMSIVTVCKDVSHEERLERQLRQSQKMEAVGQLAGGIAHDFNNIIQAILGNVEFASEGLEPGEARHRDLEQIRTAANRAAALTRQLLAFSRQQVLEPAAAELDALIRNILPLVRTVLSEDIELDYRPGSGLAPVLADASQIEQVLMNLCLNSRDAMPGGGRLTITTGAAVIDTEFQESHSWAAPGQYVVLEVADTGEGMDEDTRRQVFEPFFSTKEVGKGTGLGLATVYGIVKQHRGLIRIESTPGESTSVQVYLPHAGQPIEPESRPASAARTGGTETILLAEDDANVLDTTTRILERAGYTIIQARDGREALELYARRGAEIDLCLLDLVMPRLGGRDVAQAIRDADRKARVIFLSGYNPDAVAARSGGADDRPALMKPVPTTELLAEIRRSLDGPPV